MGYQGQEKSCNLLAQYMKAPTILHFFSLDIFKIFFSLKYFCVLIV